GSVPLGIAAGIMEDPTEIRWSFSFIWILLTLSVFGSALVYWLWTSVLAMVPLSRANAFSFLVPIFGLTMGAMFYGETLGWPELVGITLAIVGVHMVARHGIAPPVENPLPITRAWN
ncbi:MAG: EamA family transporter, partial [Pseudomonadales bacterium]